MKKLFLLLIFISSLSFSQEFQGKAFYMSKINVDKSWMDNPRFANRRGYMEEMIKKNTEKNYFLNSPQLNLTQKEIKLILVSLVDIIGWQTT